MVIEYAILRYSFFILMIMYYKRFIELSCKNKNDFNSTIINIILIIEICLH